MKLHDLPRASGVPSIPNTGANSKPPEGTPEAARRCRYCSDVLTGHDPRVICCSRRCATKLRWNCHHNQAARDDADRLCARVRVLGWSAVIVDHPVQGWCVEALLPGVRGPVLLVSPDDLAWLLIDLRRAA